MTTLKKIAVVLIIILAHQFISTSVMAQTPNQFKYQAVLRNADGTIMANEDVAVDISILQGSASGTSVFTEQHSVTTTAQGLINLNIGSVEDLSVVDFSNDTYFVEISINGTVMGTSQLLSVPYALHSKTAENVFSGDYNDLTNNPAIVDSVTAVLDTTTQFVRTEVDGSVTNEIQNLSEVLTESNDAGATQIKNIADPTDNQDAATKAYIDEMLIQAGVYTVKDFDGNIYKTVKIGNQIWMAENLKVTHYPDGTAIPLVTDNTAWANLGDNNTDDAYCFYNNNSSSDYGALYTCAAAIGDNWTRDNKANQGVCPDGWHLPSDAEWTVLTNYLGGASVAGGKMKETGTTHWNSPNTGATDESGFTALPGGRRHRSNGSFGSVGSYGYWWSSTENSGPGAYYRALGYGDAEAHRYLSNKSYGFSVRCIRDN